MPQASVNSETRPPQPSTVPTVPGEFVGQTDRRSSPRVPLSMPASLIPLGSTELLNCRADNIGEGGVHLTTSIGYGLGVGQRYELLLRSEDAPSGVETPATGEGHYATVVRTEMQVGENGGKGAQDCVGVGLRFDQPLVL